MFEGLAARYDLLDRLFSLGLDGVWRRRAVRALELRPGDRVLDAATGTGELARTALACVPGVTVVGLDFALGMLARGRSKPTLNGPEVSFFPVGGDALRLPFPDACFDAVTIGYGLRNTADHEVVLDEFHRVLVPGGKLLVLEFGMPPGRIVRPLYRVYFHRVMPRLAGWMFGHRPPFAYLAASVEAYEDASRLTALLQARGFRPQRTLLLTRGISHALIARSEPLAG